MGGKDRNDNRTATMRRTNISKSFKKINLHLHHRRCPLCPKSRGYQVVGASGLAYWRGTWGVSSPQGQKGVCPTSRTPYSTDPSRPRKSRSCTAVNYPRMLKKQNERKRERPAEPSTHSKTKTALTFQKTSCHSETSAHSETSTHSQD